MALSNGIIPEYVNMLVRSTAQVVTSHIVTSTDLSTNIIFFRRDFIRQLELHNPDIVHIHASWDFRAAVIEQTARSKGYFTIVSPHGGLAPEVTERNFWRYYLPRIICYQLRMIKRCHCLVAISEKEVNDMKQLKWKRNLALVPHPLTSEISEEDTRHLIMETYRKVIDTNYMQRLTAEEEMLVNACLKASLWPDEEEVPVTIPDIVSSDISFRRVYFYVHDQHVSEAFINGAHRLGISIPPQLNVEATPRFNVKQRRNIIRHRGLVKLYAILTKLTGKTEENVPPHTPKDDLDTLLRIYALLRFKDFDEDAFNKLIRRQGIRHFTKGILRELTEKFQLEPGFTPFKIQYK